MRSRAEAGASVPRTGEPRPGGAGAAPIFPGGKGPAGSWSRTQESGDALRLPRTLTEDQSTRGEHAKPWRPSSLKSCSTCPAGPQSSSEAAQAEAPRRGSCMTQEHDSSSTGPGAPPGTGRGQEGTGQQGRYCHWAAPSCGDQGPPPAPRSIQATAD